MLHGPVWTSHWWQAHPLLGVAAVLVMLGALLLFLKGFSARIGPYPELLRKLVHMGIGLVTLSFPWLFADPWPVFLLAGAACVLMTAVKAPGRLRTLMGGVVDGVERRTHGDVYFPIGVAGLFWLAQRADAMEEQLLFVIPMLLLTLGDAVAALVGVRYGRHRFTTGEGGKSVEGSLACFVAAFLSTLLPLLQVWRTDHAQAVIIAVIVGMLATALEAVAWSGLDNLFLPLGGYLILHTHLHMGSQALAAHLFVTIALFVFVIMWRRRTTLNDSAALGAALYAYCAWSIGGLEWLYAPVLLFVGYPLLWPRTEGDSGRVHSISVVLNVGGAGLVWLVLSVAIPFRDLAHSYNVAFAAQMAMIGLARLRHRYPRTSGAILLLFSAALSWLLLVVPALALAAMATGARTSVLPARIVAALAGIAVAVILFDRIRRDLRTYPCDPGRWRLQAALGALGSLIGTAPQLWGS